MKSRKILIVTVLIVIFFDLSLKGQSQIDIDFLTFNIWQEGTSVPNGLKKIRDIIVEINPDIVSFTEVRNYGGEDWTQKIVHELSAVGLNFHRGFAGGDVSIISKYPITASSLIYNGEGSIARFDLDVNGNSLIVAAAHLDYTYYACYLPRGYNGGNPNWNVMADDEGNPVPVVNIDQILTYNLLSSRDEQIEAFIDSLGHVKTPVVLMGDFNEPSHLDWVAATDSMFDHNGLVIPWQNTLVLENNRFTDAYREFFPNEVANPGITWPSYADGVGSTSWTPLSDERDRIDYVFYRGSGIKTAFASLVGPKISYVYNQPDSSYTSNENFLAKTLAWPSDHKAVFVTLTFDH